MFCCVCLFYLCFFSLLRAGNTHGALILAPQKEHAQPPPAYSEPHVHLQLILQASITNKCVSHSLLSLWPFLVKKCFEDVPLFITIYPIPSWCLIVTCFLRRPLRLLLQRIVVGFLHAIKFKILQSVRFTFFLSIVLLFSKDAFN